MRTFLITAATLLLALAGCARQPAAPAAPALPKLDTFTLQAGAPTRGRSWDGVVEAVQQATLTAQTTGRVTVVNVDVDDPVAAGDVLLRLTAIEQQAGANTARAQLQAAQAAASEAEANFRRYSALAEGQFVSRAQIDQARAARDSAMAARDAARAQLAQAGQQAEYTVIRAPFDGVVTARQVEPGESVAPGQPLLSVHAPGALRIEVRVPQSEGAAIRAATGARVLLADGRDIEAAKIMAFPAADPLTHSVAVRVTLPDVVDPPMPGTVGKVVFSVAGAADAGVMRVPVDAIMQRGEISGVYVVAGERVVLRQVRLGQRIGAEVEVIAGLKPGERIATDPVAAVQALASQRQIAGNAHD